jgi:hypothetical protein
MLHKWTHKEKKRISTLRYRVRQFAVSSGFNGEDLGLQRIQFALILIPLGFDNIAN